MRSPLIIGNWKLNGNSLILDTLVNELNKKLFSIKKCQIAIAPPIVYLDRISKSISNNIKLCAQNVDINLSGAFTGDISAEMLKDIGVKYIIVGHSERRLYHREDNNYIAQKYAVIKSLGLTPVLCIGETSIENINGKTKEVCKLQIDTILDCQGITAFKNAVIAYEPVWAIGTGKSATPLQIQSVHKFIRNYIAQQDIDIADELIIQYGGSINITNAATIIIQPDVDGFLVGAASLNPTVFSNVIKIVETSKNLIKNKN
ncbi:triose-phosphate isomerase [Candidatus Pantoea edessiphila]|uniref:Triosephosphate isomerase n=1 Tax=Candidatus Pantoea edessiphila TaxID=2044610 RepID=A0A2P5SX82_9GAMM|nr:triose-phosphate isomerase [Candidatus Pantoea edessiphila]PPI86912.1 triose-phosphate isomerase [Candidatus Pantoea edessiphila]